MVSKYERKKKRHTDSVSEEGGGYFSTSVRKGMDIGAGERNK